MNRLSIKGHIRRRRQPDGKCPLSTVHQCVADRRDLCQPYSIARTPPDNPRTTGETDGERECTLDINDTFYQLRTTNEDRFIGTAFGIAPKVLMTCRHVVNDRSEGEAIAIRNQRGQRWNVRPDQIWTVEPGALDLALILDAFNQDERPFFPILPHNNIMIGEDVYSFGFFMTTRTRRGGPAAGDDNQGYLKGNIVNVSQPPHEGGTQRISLSYPVIEGMSGAPVLTYHNGVKVVGLCYGNVQSRVVAAEILEHEADGKILRERVERIVEFGRAYPSPVLAAALGVSPAKGWAVTAERTGAE